MKFCDHSHSTDEELRVLPTDGGGNLIVCYKHYKVELSYRKEMKDKNGGEWQFPKWDSLRVYGE